MFTQRFTRSHSPSANASECFECSIAINGAYSSRIRRRSSSDSPDNRLASSAIIATTAPTRSKPMRATDSPRIEFDHLNTRTVTSDFEGGRITSDGGVLLLGEVDRLYRITERLAECFTDHRDAERTEHPLQDLLRQRIYALCCGYEDLNDHDRLRFDALLAAVIGKEDPQGENRRREADRRAALAGKSTLNRLELGIRYRKHRRRLVDRGNHWLRSRR
jgi:hypothetical protein